MIADHAPVPPALITAAPLEGQSTTHWPKLLIGPLGYMVAHRAGRHASSSRPELKFVLIRGNVDQILPDNPHGFGHQRFLLHCPAGAPPELEVDVDLTYGHRVDGLKVGEQLEVKGVLYHDAARGNRPAHDGIHWTHHRRHTGDAGYIKDPAGRVYE